ncbi:MAG: glycosyltransferase [Lachnospiraceae bacterium]|nr:glycosyltransferase [Lachnospiraceae bacterium]
MKKIAVLDIAASKTGALSILRDFAAFIRDNDKENEWIFITGAEGLLEESERIRVIARPDVKASKVNRLKFDWFEGAKFLSSLECDVVLSMQNTLPKGNITGRGGRPARTVVYEHQPLGFQRAKKFSPFKKYEREYAMYQYLIQGQILSSIKRADRAIVQTEWMKEAVIRDTGISKERVFKAMPDVPELSEFRHPEKWCRNKFFYPAGMMLYKNHQVIVDAVKLLKEQGCRDFEVIFTLERADAPWIEGEVPSEIKWLGPLKRERVMELYSESTLVFPSYIETFGFPPAEAKSIGTLVLAADMPFTREVLGEYKNARFFDAFDAAELAKYMKAVLEGKLSPVSAVEDNTEHENAYAKIVRVLCSD